MTWGCFEGNARFEKGVETVIGNCCVEWGGVVSRLEGVSFRACVVEHDLRPRIVGLALRFVLVVSWDVSRGSSEAGVVGERR